MIDEDGEFSTPNYPSRYSSNTECIWVIKPKSPANAIELRFKSFSLEPESRCGYDFLEVANFQLLSCIDLMLKAVLFDIVVLWLYFLFVKSKLFFCR